VIGRAKFSYDLWGDTVNTASRMESHAAPGTIQVSPGAYARLRDRYELRPRGTIEIKGKGAMRPYSLLGPIEDRQTLAGMRHPRTVHRSDNAFVST
jgi:adenylate cyclase